MARERSSSGKPTNPASPNPSARARREALSVLGRQLTEESPSAAIPAPRTDPAWASGTRT